MIRILQGHTNKAQSVMYTAAADMTRGAFITVNEGDMTAAAATGETFYMVDIAKTYNGINAVVEPLEKDFEGIKQGDRVIAVPILPGERYATSEVTVGDAAIGDKMAATAGKLAKADNGDWIYCGEHSDPTGIPMFIVKRA